MLKNKAYGLIIFILIITFIFIFNDIVINNKNVYVLITSCFIVSFSLIKLFFSKSQPYSLNTIFYLFIFFFIGIAPILQFKKGVYFLGENSKLTNADFLFGNFIFILAIAFYEIIYRILIKKTFKDNSIFKPLKNKKSNIFSPEKILFLSIGFTVLFLFLFSFNFEAIFFRKFLWSNKIKFVGLRPLLISLTRIIPVILFLFFKLSSRKNFKIELSLLALVIFCNFPTGIARFKIAITYLPIIIIYFNRFLNRKVFALSFITLFLTVFPYLHHFRYNNNLIPEKVFDFSMFTEAHFDSYQNSVNVITNEIVTNGNQFIGALFFFIPRSLWKNKAEGSGHVLAQKLDYDGFSNVAISFFGEGYINFGFIGVFFFIIILAFSNAFLDYKFWKYDTKIYFKVIYLIFIPLEFLMLRGGLRTSIVSFQLHIFLIFFLFYLLKNQFYKK